MTKKRSADEFLERLAFQVASAVAEDDDLLEEELKLIPAAGQLIEGIRASGLRAVAVARRERMLRAAGKGDHGQQSSARYAALNRAELIPIIVERFRAARAKFAVQHRNLDALTDEDLRSLLEELDQVVDKK